MRFLILGLVFVISLFFLQEDSSELSQVQSLEKVSAAVKKSQAASFRSPKARDLSEEFRFSSANETSPSVEVAQGEDNSPEVSSEASSPSLSEIVAPTEETQRLKKAEKIVSRAMPGIPSLKKIHSHNGKILPTKPVDISEPLNDLLAGKERALESPLLRPFLFARDLELLNVLASQEGLPQAVALKILRDEIKELRQIAAAKKNPPLVSKTVQCSQCIARNAARASADDLVALLK